MACKVGGRTTADRRARPQESVGLGKTRRSGILRSMPSRRSFLEDKSHRIRFVDTPRDCSWLNQIELWFSIPYVKDAKAPQAVEFLVGRSTEQGGSCVHRLLQRSPRAAVQVDLPRQATPSVRTGSTLPPSRSSPIRQGVSNPSTRRRFASLPVLRRDLSAPVKALVVQMMHWSRQHGLSRNARARPP